MTDVLQLSVIIFRDEQGKILLQFRDSNAPNEALRWSFFGGVSEGNESPSDAIIREVKEELDMDIKESDIVLLAERDWVSPNTKREKVVHFYEYKNPIDWNDFSVLEGAGAAFFTKEEIAMLPNASLLSKTFIADYC